jgi:hypothetical protein
VESGRSVPRDDRAADAVVDPYGHEVDIAMNVGVSGETAIGHEVEGDAVIVLEDVIIFDRERPVRSKAVFKIGADRATPTGVVVAAY